MKGTAQKAGAFLTDVKELRRRARVHLERGAVTEGYQADRKTVLALLSEPRLVTTGGQGVGPAGLAGDRCWAVARSTREGST